MVYLRSSFLLTALAACLHTSAQQSLPLEGIWKFKPDPFETGINSNGVQLLPQLPETITLPGSTDLAGKGFKTQGMTSLRLTRAFEYKGIAWYEKEVYVPAGWKDKEIMLFLERAHWETAVWVNGSYIGRRESLSVPHTYNITPLVQAGKKNVIRIRVNNDKIHDIEYSHAISAETQTNWNGIIGKMALQAFDKIHLDNVQAYPQIKEKQARVTVKIQNRSGKAVNGVLTFSGDVPKLEVPFSGRDSVITVAANVPVGATVRLWDEFHPNLYHLRVQLRANDVFADSTTVTFGMRELSTQGTRFLVNGQPVFMRSTVNSAEFPITGFPAMDTLFWQHVFSTCKAYGLNAMRFHSWCPPEAAFEVADRMGCYLQVENSDWRFTIGKDSATNRFLTEEAERILDTYGNHPSFALLCEGNELVGPTVKTFLGNLVNSWKQKDPRHLYTGGSGYPAIPEDDFHDFYGPRPQRWKEGLKSRFNAQPLNTLYDYATEVSKFKVPIMTHEIGQWCVYPDYRQIPKYTGVLKPYNYELFRESLREHHMLDQAEEFTMASGKFQVIQKKEEVESYLRTPGMGGYTMLQLNDFPGQGTSPVGVVDVFWDPKPYVDGKAFSRFQSARVPLLRTAGFTWTNNQSFEGTVEFANFGEGPMQDAVVEWQLRYRDGRTVAAGSFDRMDIPLGSPLKIGHLSIPLQGIPEAAQLELTVGVAGTEISNHWDVWVYPEKLPDVAMRGITVTDKWDSKTKQVLQKGGTVLLLADTAMINTTADPCFSGISWNAVWSGMPPNLLGTLCDTLHPAFRHFPTAFHSNWQWWDIVRHSKPLVLDHTPDSFRPLVQMIPDWNTNRKIGLLLEAKVGNGRLLLCAVDVQHDMEHRPVARQFRYSLQKYVSSPAFQPAGVLTTDMIDTLFKK